MPRKYSVEFKEKAGHQIIEMVRPVDVGRRNRTGHLAVGALVEH